MNVMGGKLNGMRVTFQQLKMLIDVGVSRPSHNHMIFSANENKRHKHQNMRTTTKTKKRSKQKLAAVTCSRKRRLYVKL